MNAQRWLSHPDPSLPDKDIEMTSFIGETNLPGLWPLARLHEEIGATAVGVSQGVFIMWCVGVPSIWSCFLQAKSRRPHCWAKNNQWMVPQADLLNQESNKPQTMKRLCCPQAVRNMHPNTNHNDWGPSGSCPFRKLKRCFYPASALQDLRGEQSFVFSELKRANMTFVVCKKKYNVRPKEIQGTCEGETNYGVWALWPDAPMDTQIPCQSLPAVSWYMCTLIKFIKFKKNLLNFKKLYNLSVENYIKDAP